MKCDKIQIKLALHEKLNQQEAEHVAQCANCRAFAQDLARLIPPTLATPEQLKENTLTLSLAVIAVPQTMPMPIFSRLQELWRSPNLAIALAVFCGIWLIALAIAQFYCDGAGAVCRLAALFLAFVFLQNMVAALCFPILIRQKILFT